MLKCIDGYLLYDNTAPADTDRDAFETTLNSEFTNVNIVPTLSISNESTFVTNEVATKTVFFTIFYSSSNVGINTCETFWTTCQNELNKATVITGSYIRNGDSLHDLGFANPVFTIESK